LQAVAVQAGPGTTAAYAEAEVRSGLQLGDNISRYNSMITAALARGMDRWVEMDAPNGWEIRTGPVRASRLRQV
jgi:hypothetical protein